MDMKRERSLSAVNVASTGFRLGLAVNSTLLTYEIAASQALWPLVPFLLISM